MQEIMKCVLLCGSLRLAVWKPRQHWTTQHSTYCNCLASSCLKHAIANDFQAIKPLNPAEIFQFHVCWRASSLTVLTTQNWRGLLLYLTGFCSRRHEDHRPFSAGWHHPETNSLWPLHPPPLPPFFLEASFGTEITESVRWTPTQTWYRTRVIFLTQSVRLALLAYFRKPFHQRALCPDPDLYLSYLFILCKGVKIVHAITMETLLNRRHGIIQQGQHFILGGLEERPLISRVCPSCKLD